MGIFALKRAACIPRAFNRRHGFFDLDLFSSNFPNFFFLLFRSSYGDRLEQFIR